MEFNMNDDFEKAVKFAQGIMNLKDLCEIVRNQECIKDAEASMNGYIEWLKKLTEDPQANSEVLCDQMNRVVPKMTFSLRTYLETGKALRNEFDGIRSDIVDYDDSFFTIDDKDDEGEEP